MHIIHTPTFPVAVDLYRNSTLLNQIVELEISLHRSSINNHCVRSNWIDVYMCVLRYHALSISYLFRRSAAVWLLVWCGYAAMYFLKNDQLARSFSFIHSIKSFDRVRVHCVLKWTCRPTFNFVAGRVEARKSDGKCWCGVMLYVTGCMDTGWNVALGRRSGSITDCCCVYCMYPVLYMIRNLHFSKGLCTPVRTSTAVCPNPWAGSWWRKRCIYFDRRTSDTLKPVPEHITGFSPVFFRNRRFRMLQPGSWIGCGFTGATLDQLQLDCSQGFDEGQ